MFWVLGLRSPLTKPNSCVIRTHVSRAAKKITEQSASGTPKAGPGQTSAGVEGAASLESKDARKSRIAQSLFPKFMKTYAARFQNAPVSHIASFLIVHELSAVVPLFGLWGAFYYFDYVPIGVPDVIVDEGSKFIRRMAERNDWQSLIHAEKGSRIILQGAASYFIVKAILPLRLIFSLWAMPWFARRCVIPINSVIAKCSRRLFRKEKS